MADRWAAWQSELRNLSPFAGEWNDGQAEDFLSQLQELVARKRGQRESILKLTAKVRCLHEKFRQLLAFFDLEQACVAWASSSCDGADVDRALELLAEWRKHLEEYGDKFPPPASNLATYSAMQACMVEAQAAEAAIRPCFDLLDGIVAGLAPAPVPPICAEAEPVEPAVAGFVPAQAG
jgi:hypothetical protein